MVSFASRRMRRPTSIILLLSVAIMAHCAIGLQMLRSPKIAFGDGIEYLDAAYHLHRNLTYTMSSDPVAPSSVGREPGYPIFLALLMSLDAGMASYHPACGGADTVCDPARFRLLSIANLLLIEVTSLLLFGLVRGLTGSGATALVAAGYILVDVNLLRSHWYDPMSDELALALVALAMLTLQRAWGREAAGRWCCVGLAFAALTLCKAVFLPFSVGLASWAAIHLAIVRFRLRGSPPMPASVQVALPETSLGQNEAFVDRGTLKPKRFAFSSSAEIPDRSPPMRRPGRMLALAAAVYTAMVCGWVVRNCTSPASPD